MLTFANITTEATLTNKVHAYARRGWLMFKLRFKSCCCTKQGSSVAFQNTPQKNRIEASIANRIEETIAKRIEALPENRPDRPSARKPQGNGKATS